MTLPSVYNPHDVEERWYSLWEKEGYFRPCTDAAKTPFTIVIPPPNVTGILHMGHALNNTLQDILIRYRRMAGCRALWVPGTDHAGIATQNVVERKLAQEGINRHDLGRDAFVKRVWEWRKEYGSTIVRQLRKLGSSCDWERERFTMDEGLSCAVETAFLKLYESGLIYRGHYLVNWCPRCHTALSDEEVQHEDVKGNLWAIRYPAADNKGEGIVVATTRPETMLGDVAVAVHPADKRYQKLVGSAVQLPLTGRTIPIITDDAVGQEFGTGAVKVTPAHDPVDFEIGRRHLELIPKDAKRQDWTSIPIQIMSIDGRMTNVPKAYDGMDRFDCRKQVLKDLEAQGLLVKTEDYQTAVGHCYRCKTIVEPMLSPQWFVKMAPLAKLGIEAVERDGMRFVPGRWNKIYLDWLEHIRDWCISRQIWWGHRIPVWTCVRCNAPEVKGHGEWVKERYQEPGMVVMPQAQMSAKPPTCPACGKSDQWQQDPDVLDTWFSSWLWPFSTLGWPEKTQDLATHYPTSVLVTGQDIIFFWVARMVMAGKFFLKKLPFKDVYIHGIIRVEGGKKMSKSLGNIIDPLEVIERLGTDALRFSIAHMTSEGQDLYLSEDRFLLGRNFANKLWNAARLILEGASRREMSSPRSLPSTPIEGRGSDPRFHEDDASKDALTLADRWILSRLQRTTQQVTEALEQYQFNEATRRLYQFVWREFCDWYLEVAKLQRQEADKGRVQNTDQVLLEVLEGTLKLLHPFMPFITEELWQKMAERSGKSLMQAPWPKSQAAWVDQKAEDQFQKLQGIITEVRNIRATFRVAAKQKVDLMVRAGSDDALLTAHEKWITRFGAVNTLKVGSSLKRPAGSVAAHLGD